MEGPPPEQHAMVYLSITLVPHEQAGHIGLELALQAWLCGTHCQHLGRRGRVALGGAAPEAGLGGHQGPPHLVGQLHQHDELSRAVPMGAPFGPPALQPHDAGAKPATILL